jgi:hypothetical protein
MCNNRRGVVAQVCDGQLDGMVVISFDGAGAACVDASFPSCYPDVEYLQTVESRDLTTARQIVEHILDTAGLAHDAWETNPNLCGRWDYCTVTLHAKSADDFGATMCIGISSGGVVSVDGDPFTPTSRLMNTRYTTIHRSIHERTQFIHTVRENSRLQAAAWQHLWTR